MKISYNWLKDLIHINSSPEETAALLTGSGLEVEGISPYLSIAGGLDGVVIGEVKTRVKHPNADKLSITTVNVGGEKDLQIVCGAPNVAEGQKVLVATVGATLYPAKGAPFTIGKSKIRGEVSEGMICAEDELGLGESHEGILVLPGDYVPGKKASDYFPVYSDHLIEIGLTANRGDAASHLGVARDLKALTHIPLTELPIYPLGVIKKTGNEIDVKIEDTKGCLRYSGISISGVTVGDSPEWLKNRLRVIGLSPINNIVDATNYVLHELGQPLHAFDADLIAGKKIVVRTPARDTKFTTLDKAVRTLSGNECMICDAEKPLAIGGVFGGLDSGVNAGTRNIFIESACFHPASIRKTAKYHGLSTDASFRFERGTDPNITIRALERVTRIITEIAGGEVSSAIVDVYPEKIENARIPFSLDRFERLIGQHIPEEEIREILTWLEIGILDSGEKHLTLSVPPYRVDVKREVDISEEILRIYGLNKISIPLSVRSAIVSSEDTSRYALRNRVSGYLSANGFLELVNNSLTRSAYYSSDQQQDAVKMLNPLSADLDMLRKTMLYSGLESIQFNVNRKATDLRFYEFGYTYLKNGEKYEETPHLALFLCGMKEPESWNAPHKETSYFTLKSIVVNALHKAGIPSLSFDYKKGDVAGLINHTRIFSGEHMLVAFGTLEPDITSCFDIDRPVFHADFNWDGVLRASSSASFTLAPLSPFPQVRRDLALVLDQQVRYEEIERIAFRSEPRLLKSINVFDVYEGEKIGTGKKSYAVSFILEDLNKTLTDSEIEGVMGKLIRQFEKDLGATLRS